MSRLDPKAERDETWKRFAPGAAGHKTTVGVKGSGRTCNGKNSVAGAHGMVAYYTSPEVDAHASLVEAPTSSATVK